MEARVKTILGSIVSAVTGTQTKSTSVSQVVKDLHIIKKDIPPSQTIHLSTLPPSPPPPMISYQQPASKNLNNSLIVKSKRKISGHKVSGHKVSRRKVSRRKTSTSTRRRKTGRKSAKSHKRATSTRRRKSK